MEVNVDSFNIDDGVFTILAHPLRRKILKALFDSETITFSVLSTEWGIVTGTIYHHLKILSPLISKDDINEYHLTVDGIKICEWFLKTKSGRSTVQKIDSFTLLTHSIENWIYTNQNFVLMLGLISAGFAIFLATQIEVHLFGVFMVPDADSKELWELILWNLVSAISIILLLTISGSFAGQKQILINKKLLTRFLFAILPSNIVIIIIWALHMSFGFELSLVFWIIISFINQGFFLFIISSSMINIYGYSVERSALIALLNLYIQFTAVFLLN